MNGAEIGIFKQPNEVSFSRLLQRQNRVALETQICLEILCDFSDKPLEWELADKKLSTLLVLADFSVSHTLQRA